MSRLNLNTIRLFLLPLVLVLLGAAPAPLPLPAPVPCPGCWVPPQVQDWQWQLTSPVDLSVSAGMFDVDLFDVPASTIASLHASGRRAVCYISAGTWENWRPDAAAFPAAVKGKANGWPGERWLDIRQTSVLLPIMAARLDLCKSKGFDGVEFDNVDAWDNDSGFPITAQQQLIYNALLANEAHKRALSAALKNDVEQAAALLPYFDWALVEECFAYNECDKLAVFVNAGKAVMHVEYRARLEAFCAVTAAGLGFNSMRKKRNLGAWRQVCP